MTAKHAGKSAMRGAIAKRDNHRAPHVKVLVEAKSAAFPAGRMLIPSPLALQDIVATVPPGRVITVSALRKALARRFRADYTCPVTAGIVLRIGADAAEEDRANGAADVMPWWRVVRDDGSLFEKFPGGAARHGCRRVVRRAVRSDRRRRTDRRPAGGTRATIAAPRIRRRCLCCVEAAVVRWA